MPEPGFVVVARKFGDSISAIVGPGGSNHASTQHP